MIVYSLAIPYIQYKKDNSDEDYVPVRTSKRIR
jgi:hypothetical protein